MKFLTRNPLLSLLLIITLLKGVLTSIVVPLWEFPDEQAHFAQVSHYVEKGLSITHGNNLSKEIYESEMVMGTLRDNRGNNRYTYRSGYKPIYSTTTVGVYEKYLQNLPQHFRKEFVPNKDEAPRYPPLFYLVTSVGYIIAYSQDLFTRVFFSRLISIIISLATVWVTYNIGQLLFGRFYLASLTLATMVAFHPMFSFVSSGINNDNLVNLLGAIILWLGLQTFRKGLTVVIGMTFGLVTGLGVLTKQSIMPVSLTYLVLLILEWFRSKRSVIKELILLTPLISALILGGGWFVLRPLLETGNMPFLPRVDESSALPNLGLTTHFKNLATQYYQETLVWYWGVFKWLGVVLPLNVVRLIKILIVISSIGLLLHVKKAKPLVAKKYTLVLMLFTFVYLVVISIWDYQMMRSMGFSIGIQGRYFFPTLVAHMALLLIGWCELFPARLRPRLLFFICFGFILLHTCSFGVLIDSYYHLTNGYTLLLQMSQYKPWFLKWPYMVFWLAIYSGFISLFVKKLLDSEKIYARNK